MKILVLKDGTALEFTDNSTINNLITVVPNFGEIEVLRNFLTEENLSECTFDGVDYKGVLLIKITANADGYGNITAIFSTRFATDAEIEKLRQQVAELQTENAQLSDKAEAADILMGNEEV